MENLQKKFEQVAQSIAGAKADLEKFTTKQNKAAAIRVRKALQEVKKLAQELRTEIQDTKNSL